MDLMGLNLQHIAKKLEGAMPLTWGVIKMLLDAKSATQFHGKKTLKQTVNYYDDWHAEDIDNAPVNETCSDGSMQDETESDEESEPPVTIKKEDKTLKGIVCYQMLWKRGWITHLWPRKHVWSSWS